MEQHDWAAVKSTPLFGAMPMHIAQTIVGNHGPKLYEKGTLLFQQGEPATAFFVILDGWVKVYRITPDGEEAVVGVFHRGETFAEAAMFLGGRYPACAEVVTSARLLRIEGDSLRRQIREQPDVAMSMLASASYHLKFLVEQIEQIKLMSAPQRIACFLVQQSLTREGPCTVELPYEKSLIANRLGMKPESFSRALAKLRPLGVTVNRENVTVSEIRVLIDFIERAEGEI